MSERKDTLRILSPVPFFSEHGFSEITSTENQVLFYALWRGVGVNVQNMQIHCNSADRQWRREANIYRGNPLDLKLVSSHNENMNMKGLECTDVYRKHLSTMDASSLSVTFISTMCCKVLGMYTSDLIASVIYSINFLIPFDCKSGSVL